jgi:inhibitor of cysteine peptidase
MSNRSLSVVLWFVGLVTLAVLYQAADPAQAAPAASDPPVRRIQFQPGAASAVVAGTMDAAGMDRYVLRAMAGQTMWVTVTATEGAGILVIYGADGIVLISDHADATSWNGLLPASQDYYIDVKGTPASATTYTLLVAIPPRTTGRTVEITDQVELKVGDALDVTLDGNPTTGYVWEVQWVDSDVLQPVGETDFEPDSGAVGSGGRVTLHFVALATGQTPLQLIYHRPWEQDVPPIRTFEVAVTVR